MNILRFIKYIKAPLILIACLAVIVFLGEIKIIPEFQQLVDGLKGVFREYGLIVVLIASLLENTVIINFAFPGAIVILSAMALSVGNIPLAIATFLCIWCGSVLGLLISYFVGLKASGTASGSLKQKSYLRIFGSTFWHPQLASMSIYSCGINKETSSRVFVSAIIINFAWNLFWGFVVYNFGNFFDSSESIKFLLFIVLMTWVLLLTRTYYRERR